MMDELTREQLIRALQAELRCIQDYTRLSDGCMPGPLWEIVRTHAETSRQLSQQLWEAYGVSCFSNPVVTS